MDPNREQSAYAFCQPVADWFSDAFESPTPVQEQAWQAIQSGQNTLVIAPTGSGKTLAAFLSAIDRLAAEKARAKEGAPAKKGGKGVRILYVSPLKALGADVERNLQAPLAAIAQRQQEAGASTISQISVGMRTGDTASSERARLVRNPPDILITTPESLYLMLTSKARTTLSTVDTLIIDEVHSIAGTKRGAHFSLSLERLDALLPTPMQRIGLSATIKPVETAARFLGGIHPVTVVKDDAPPSFSLDVVVPVSDMTNIAPRGQRGASTQIHGNAEGEEGLRGRHSTHGADLKGPGASSATPDTRLGSFSIWPYIEASILDQVLAHSSTIVFVNSRGICERLTAHLNAAYDQRMGRMPLARVFAGQEGAHRSEIGSTTQLVADSEEPIAKAHHGSVSKDRRLEIERDLKEGRLKCVVATSSLELGIDMGEVDLVIQVAAPLSISSGLQRIGRANHRVNGKSVGLIYPRTRLELLDTAFMARGMMEGAIEKTDLVRNALDVLAQQTAAEVSMHAEGVSPDAWLSQVRRSACYEDLPQSAFDSVLDMLAGAYSGPDSLDFAPRILFDREQRILKPLPRTQKLAVSAAGTIPDRGLYPVMLKGPSTQKGRKRVGELDEEMVHESRVGDVIILGTSTWRITQITNDRVLVTPAPGRSARLPFWHGEGPGRSLDAGRARGQMQRALDAQTSQKGSLTTSAQEQLASFGFTENGIKNLGALIALQRASTEALPSDRLILLEICPDEAGSWHVIIHSPFGKRIHEPWALALSGRIQEQWGFNPQCAASDDGIVMRFPAEDPEAVTERLVAFAPDEIADIVTAHITDTSLFAARFRECAARALLMRPTSPGKRTPLWQQRLRGGQLLEAARTQPGFPIFTEAVRECLSDVYDLAGLRWLMEQLESGAIRVKRVQTDHPSPFASPLLFGYVAEHLYDADMPHAERANALLSVDPSLLGELLGAPDQLSLLEPEAISSVTLDAQRLTPERKLAGAEGAAELVRLMGPLSLEQIAARVTDPKDAPAHLDALEEAHRLCAISLPRGPVWATPEDALRLHELTGLPIPEWALAWRMTAEGTHPGSALAATFARSQGFFTANMLARQIGVGDAVAEDALQQLAKKGIVRTMAVSSQAEEVLRTAFDLLESAVDAFGIPSSAAPSLPAASEERLWVQKDMLGRMRLKSRDLIEGAIKPVEDCAFAQLVCALQQIGGSPENSAEEDLGQCISLFEGAAYPLAVWERTIFPTRVPGFKSALLDSFLETHEVIWQASSVSGKGPGKGAHVRFFPADSPFAPELLDRMDLFEEAMQPEPGSAAPVEDPLAQEILAVLLEEGSAPFSQVAKRLQGLSEDEPLSVSALARAFEHLLFQGRITSTTINAVRRAPAVTGAGGKADRPAPARKRISSRRSLRTFGRSHLRQERHDMRTAMAQERQSFEALDGLFTPLMEPEASSTERALAQVESILDRYGVVCPATIDAAGCKGGMQAIYTVLRGMEDAGEVIRGAFVDSLGSSQFARRSLVERLRSPEDPDDRQPAFLVLDAQDPAQLYGSVLPWPDAAISRKLPQAKSGCLVILHQGRPALFASKRIRELFTFSDDAALITEAVSALVGHLGASLKGAGRPTGNDRFIVEKLNDEDIFRSPFEKIFRDLGFIQDTHGLRLLVQPF